MAERAHKEPTMEEILSSIRKIIADGDRPAAVMAEPANEYEPDAPGEPGEELGLVYDDLHPDVFPDLRSETDFEADDVEAKEDFMVFTDLPDLEADMDFQSGFDGPALSVEQGHVDPPVLPTEETPSGPAHVQPLTDIRTAETAAGYLAKLLSEINFDPKAAGEQTIDALVRELLRPMMKEWLDENLAEIVEQQVEAEVRRIASMAR